VVVRAKAEARFKFPHKALAADIAHAIAVEANHKHLTSAGFVEVSPLGLALFKVIIHVVFNFHKK